MPLISIITIMVSFLPVDDQLAYLRKGADRVASGRLAEVRTKQIDSLFAVLQRERGNTKAK